MIVVKIGGGEGNRVDELTRDVAEFTAVGRQFVLVHGGSHLTNELANHLGYPPRFITSPSGMTSRYTDRRTMEIFQMAYCGAANKRLVESLQALGVNAVGLSGMDGRIWSGPRKKAIHTVEEGKTRVVRDNLTGRVERVNVELLRLLLGQGYLPVLTPPAISDESEPINVDGDRAAAATAIALGAETLVILSNVPGLLRDVQDPRSRINRIAESELKSAADQFAGGRMRIKLLAAGEALDGGVRRVVIGDSRVEHCLRRALAGEGTVIERPQTA
jgi:acetylglutamate/LysW-gamma-L-alpha-aminoadipate kinase